MSNQYFVFKKAQSNYCVPISHVVEIYQTKEFIALSLQMKEIFGYLDFREELVPVIDITLLLNSEGSSRNESPFKTVVILSVQDYFYGIIIDKFLSTQNLTHPENFNMEADHVETNPLGYIKSIINYNKSPLTLLNVEQIGKFVFSKIGEHSKSIVVDQTQKEKSVNDRPRKTDNELFCFRIGEFKFGLPIHVIIEIIEGYGVAPLFKVSHYLRGLINLRGQIIACFDISPALGIPLRTLEENNKYIILQYNELDMALCVDSVTKIYNYVPSDIQKVTGILSEGVNEYITGVIEDEAERIFILSVENLFTSHQLKDYLEL